MHIFQAYWAIIFDIDAFMDFPGRLRHTPITLITMKNLQTFTNPAYPALVTMKALLLFLVSIIQIALTAKIRGELDPAKFALLLWLLYALTMEAFDLGDLVSID